MTLAVQAWESFGPRGPLDIRSACIELIQEMKEKDEVAYGVALTEIRLRTGKPDLPLKSVKDGMWAATEQLHIEGEHGVVNTGRRSWRRMTASDMVVWAQHRKRRSHRQIHRGFTAARAVDRTTLNMTERTALDRIEHAAYRLSELEARRAQRRQPPPSVEDPHS